MSEGVISGLERAARPAPQRGAVSNGQAELEVGRGLVALVALGSVGVLVGFWALAAWGLYMVFA
jgi:hypothetical protein